MGALPFFPLFALAFAFLLPIPSSAQLSQFTTTLASDFTNGDGFGFFSISGTLMVVGSHSHSVPLFQQGSAYLFDCASFPCSQVAQMFADDAASGDQFGYAVAISGSRVVVGAFSDSTDPIPYHGSAYLFDCSTPPCIQLTKIVADDYAQNDLFGSSVAISGDLVAIGNAPDSGNAAAYVYHCPTSSCTLVTKLTTNDSIFASVALEGGKLVVGAEGANSFHGSVSIYDCTPSSCTLGATLMASDPANSNLFGFAVAISGEMVVVGSHAANSWTGAVYIFQCTSASSCTQMVILMAPDPSDSLFGYSVAISNSVVAVGATYDSSPGIQNHGSAYLFDCLGFSCTFLTKMMASDREENEYLGSAVGLLGWKVAAGVDTLGSERPGSVKWFDPTSIICNCSPLGSLGADCDSNRQCSCKGHWSGLRCDVPDSCYGNGAFLDGSCACFSGFTGERCSDDSSSSCSPLPTVSPLDTQEIAEFMSLDSSISSDIFSFAIQSPATSQRYFSSISLNNAPNCSYPETSHFSKSFLGSPACKDVFTGSFTIPEISDECGFTLQTNEPGFTVLSGKVHVTAKDYIGMFGSHAITRTTSAALEIDLRLPSIVQVTTSELMVYSPISFQAAVTSQEYSSLTDSATIQITTSLQWPYLLSLPFLAAFPNPAFSYSLVFSDVECPQDVEGSDCLQITTLSITNIRGNAGCFFTGAYSIDWTTGCRSGQSSCPLSEPQPSSLNFTLTSENICAKVEISATVSGSMKSYTDGAFSTERIMIAAGDRMFFKVSLSSDVTIQAISIRELRVVQSDGAKIIAQNNVEVAPFMSSLEFNWNEGSPLASNELGFSFLAKSGSSASDLFDPSGTSSISTFAVEADLDLTYRTTFGRKRDVVTSSFSLSALAVLDGSKI